jgi:hypothetical protein
MLPRTFESKIDAWILILMLATMFIVSVSVAGQFNQPQGHPLWLMLLSAPVVVLLAWVLLDTRYILDSRELLVRCGPLRWVVPIAQITSAIPGRDPTSGPALSLDRVRITFGPGKVIVISPRERELFLKTLETLRRGRPPDGRGRATGAV